MSLRGSKAPGRASSHKGMSRVDMVEASKMAKPIRVAMMAILMAPFMLVGKLTIVDGKVSHRLMFPKDLIQPCQD